MYCNCTIFPRYFLLSAFYSKGMSHVHGPASDPSLPDTASTLIHCYIFKNISFQEYIFQVFTFSWVLLDFFSHFGGIIVVTHGAYWGAGGKVILLDFKFFYPISSVTMAKTLNIRPLMDWFYHLWSWSCMYFLCLYYTQRWLTNIETLLPATISHWRFFIDLYSMGSWFWM